MTNKLLLITFRFRPIRLEVSCDFTENIATLSFEKEEVRNFQLTSIRLKYKYEEQEIPDDRIECIERSRIYKFSTKSIDRHVLHNEYSCKVIVIDREKSYKMDFCFVIPYFPQTTEIALKFMASQFPSDAVAKIFNKKFIDHEDLNPVEKELLCNLQ